MTEDLVWRGITVPYQVRGGMQTFFFLVDYIIDYKYQWSDHFLGLSIFGQRPF